MPSSKNPKYVKRATITALKAAAGLTALVPAASVFPMQRPATAPRPFVAYGVPIGEPFGATCLDGWQTTVAIHAYTQTTGSGGATVPGEDAAHDIVAEIIAALDGATITLEDTPSPATAHYTCTGSQVIQDGTEADKFHGFAFFRITVSA